MFLDNVNTTELILEVSAAESTGNPVVSITVYAPKRNADFNQAIAFQRGQVEFSFFL